jgi:hypothetical protein
MNNIIIEIVVLFIVLVLYFYIVDPKDNVNFLRAIFLSIVLVLASSLPSFMGDYSAFGWGAGLIISLYSIIKVTGQSIVGSIFSLIILDIIVYVMGIGLLKYIH